MNKEAIRAQLKAKRSTLSENRRKEASILLFSKLSLLLNSHKNVLSFANNQNEIDISPLNLFLAENNQLLLPRVEDGELSIYRVTAPNTQLKPAAFGVFEPIPKKCKKVSFEEISMILVPGLGFDSNHHRIGYGKGYYDRFLSQIHHCPTIGIGFNEQLVERLPIVPHDIPLSDVYLF